MNNINSRSINKEIPRVCLYKRNIDNSLYSINNNINIRSSNITDSNKINKNTKNNINKEENLILNYQKMHSKKAKDFCKNTKFNSSTKYINPIQHNNTTLKSNENIDFNNNVLNEEILNTNYSNNTSNLYNTINIRNNICFTPNNKTVYEDKTSDVNSNQSFNNTKKTISKICNYKIPYIKEKLNKKNNAIMFDKKIINNNTLKYLNKLNFFIVNKSKKDVVNTYNKRIKFKNQIIKCNYKYKKLIKFLNKKEEKNEIDIENTKNFFNSNSKNNFYVNKSKKLYFV